MLLVLQLYTPLTPSSSFWYRHLVFTLHVWSDYAGRWGLASKLVPREQLDDEARCIASFVLEAEPRTLREYKEVMDAGLGTTLVRFTRQQ